MKKFLISSLPIYILISIAVVTVAFLAHPLGFNHYGYDYGFYAYAVQHTPLNSLAYFAGQINDYGNHLFVVLNWLRLPQIPTLNFLFILFFVLSAVVFYEIIKKFGRLASTVGLILFVFSIAQSQLYTMYLWKAAYGQLLLLIIFLIIQEQRKYLWELLPLGLILISHKTSSIIALVSLAPHYLVEITKNKKYLVGFVVLAGALLFLFGLNGFEYIKRLVNSDVINGQFLQTNLYLSYAWYLIPLASIGVYKNLKEKTNLHWLGLLGISLFFLIFKIAFYQRLILYADLALIFFNVVSLYELKNNKKQQLIFAIVTIILSVSNFAIFTKDNVKPQISGSEINEIQNFSKTHQDSFVLSLSSQDGPWLLANLGGNIRLAAPGLFEDKHSKLEWQNFWVNTTNKDFLNSYPKPLYLYERSTIFYSGQTTPKWECLNKTSGHFYEYVCSN